MTELETQYAKLKCFGYDVVFAEKIKAAFVDVGFSFVEILVKPHEAKADLGSQYKIYTISGLYPTSWGEDGARERVKLALGIEVLCEHC